MNERFLRGSNALAATEDFDYDKGHAAAIEHRKRQDVEDREVNAEDAGEVDEAAPTGLLHNLARGLGNAYRAGEGGF